MEWNEIHDKALLALYERLEDMELTVEEFTLWHGVSSDEALTRLTYLIEGDPICPAVADQLGLAQRVPMKFKRTMGEFIAQCHRALREVKPLEVPVSYATSQEESLVIGLSDWHLGKFIRHSHNQYDIGIARQRMQELIKTIIRLKEDFIKVPLKEVVILITGDMVDGGDIYPGQSWNQDVTQSVQLKTIIRMLWEMFITLWQRFNLPVRVHCVRGNHGRTGKYAPGDANWDIMLYMALTFMSWALEQNGAERPDIQITYTLEAKDKVIVNGKCILIRHDMPAQTETAAASSKFSGIHDIIPYDIILYGHLHHLALGWHQGRPAIMNGCLCGPDDLSDRMCKLSGPMQVMFGVPSDPKKPFSFFYPIYLNEGVSHGTASLEDSEDCPDIAEGVIESADGDSQSI